MCRKIQCEGESKVFSKIFWKLRPYQHQHAWGPKHAKCVAADLVAQLSAQPHAWRGVPRRLQRTNAVPTPQWVCISNAEESLTCWPAFIHSVMPTALLITQLWRPYAVQQQHAGLHIVCSEMQESKAEGCLPGALEPGRPCMNQEHGWFSSELMAQGNSKYTKGRLPFPACGLMQLHEAPYWAQFMRFWGLLHFG